MSYTLFNIFSLFYVVLRLQPLLKVIKEDRMTIAMGSLDYIRWKTFEYIWYPDLVIRYGFNWGLQFFETYFREDTIGPNKLAPRP